MHRPQVSIVIPICCLERRSRDILMRLGARWRRLPRITSGPLPGGDQMGADPNFYDDWPYRDRATVVCPDGRR